MQRGSTEKVGSDISQDAMYSRNATEQRKPGDVKKFKCHYCKRTGYFAKDCFKRKTNEKQHHNQPAAHRIESIKILMIVINQRSHWLQITTFLCITTGGLIQVLHST